MIKIFNGRWRGLENNEDAFGMILSFEFRKIIKEFRGAKLAVFITIALHSDENGLSFPSYDKLEEETGYVRGTIATTIKELCEQKINGRRILMKYRERNEKGQLISSNRYRIFPSDEEIAQSIKIEQDEENPESSLSNSGQHRLEVKPKVLKVKPEQELKSARVLEGTSEEAQSSEDSRIIAPREDQVEDQEEDIVQWFNDKKQSEIESGVRPPAKPDLPKAPRSEADVEAGIRKAVLDNAARNVDKDPAIESFIASVPEHVRELARVFCYHKGRAPLDKENKMWRREWQDQFEIGLSAENIEDAIEYMGNNNLAVRSPISTLTIAENIRGGHIKLDRDADIKSSEVSYSLPGSGQVETVDEPEISPMEQLILDEGGEDDDGE
jgi:hypothetical protein